MRRIHSCIFKVNVYLFVGVAIALEPQNLPNVAIANFWDVENVIPVIRGNKVSPILIIRILDN